jgi:hypothetical protein
MAMTGAAIGHIPANKGTRPLYILVVCRRILYNANPPA